MENERHFKLTEERLAHDGAILRRIQAVKDLPYHKVRKGDLGGWVECYENLQDDAWIFGNVKVYQKAVVSGHAFLTDYACVYGNAVVSGNTQLYGRTYIYKSATISVDILTGGQYC